MGFFRFSRLREQQIKRKWFLDRIQYQNKNGSWMQYQNKKGPWIQYQNIKGPWMQYQNKNGPWIPN